jgi:hypothetical protein
LVAFEAQRTALCSSISTPAPEYAVSAGVPWMIQSRTLCEEKTASAIALRNGWALSEKSGKVQLSPWWYDPLA